MIAGWVCNRLILIDEPKFDVGLLAAGIGRKLIPIYKTSQRHVNNPTLEPRICYSDLVKIDWKNETIGGFGVTG